jgi:hypothetical protein
MISDEVFESYVRVWLVEYKIEEIVRRYLYGELDNAEQMQTELDHARSVVGKWDVSKPIPFGLTLDDIGKMNE